MLNTINCFKKVSYFVSFIQTNVPTLDNIFFFGNWVKTSYLFLDFIDKQQTTEEAEKQTTKSLKSKAQRNDQSYHDFNATKKVHKIMKDFNE